MQPHCKVLPLKAIELFDKQYPFLTSRWQHCTTRERTVFLSLRDTGTTGISHEDIASCIKLIYILYHAKHNRYIVWPPFLTDINEF